MLRAHWMALVLLILTFQPAVVVAQQAGAAKPIFRAIDIAPFGRVLLGKHFAYRLFRGRKISAGRYELRGGQFADTRAIIVAVDSVNRVTAIDFEYLPGKRYAETVADYAATLGVPVETEARDSAGVRLLMTRWQDAETDFRVAARRIGDAEVVMSRMTDRVHH